MGELKALASNGAGAAPGQTHRKECLVRTVGRIVVTLMLLVGTAAHVLHAQQASGTVVGTLVDDYNGISLPGVPIEVVDSTLVVHTDIDGKFTMDLPPGPHTLRVLFGGYAEQSVRVVIVAGRTNPVEIGISPTRYSEELTVTAQAVEADTSTAQAQLAERQRASVITDSLGSQEMKQNADSNAATAMQRVTGLSVVDDQYVFVRGLGERYSNTVLAGASLPSVDPDRRVVPLDLFPAGLVDSVKIEKSYRPDRPAEFAGGLVMIEPLKFARTTTIDVNGSWGFNSLTTFQRALDYPGGDRDWTGFDDGTRALPGAIPGRKVVQGGVFTPDVGVLRPDLERLGESFSNVWDPVRRDAPMDQSYAVVYGDHWDKFGVMSSYSYSQKSQVQDETQNYFRTGDAGLSPFSEYEYQQSSTRSTMGFVGNAAYQFSTNHQLSFENFYTHNGLNETRTFEGFNSDIATDLRNTRLRWIEEGVLSSQVRGDHLFGASSRIDWRVTYAEANRDEPDLRETLYEFDPGTSEFVLADESQSGFRQFNDLRDETVGMSVSYSNFFTGPSALPAQVKLGGAYDNRRRDFSSRRFRYIPQRTSGVDLSLPPEQLFTPENIGTVFDLREETRTTDTYAASHELTSFYGMIDLPLSMTWRVVAGARVENFTQRVDTFDLFSLELDPAVIRAELNNTDVFPSVNLVKAIRPDMNLRVGFSQTVNRPEFRELAPFEFTDIVGGRSVVGNPDLTRALIRNLDVRWEWFAQAEELLAASFFYKDFTDPIERIVEPTSQLRTSFTNAESARNVGIELEARKRLTDVLFVAANYTFVDSEIALAAEARQVQTSLTRALAGQSKNLFNAMAEFDQNGWAARVLFNYVGDRIRDVGSLGLPDIVQKGRQSVDLVFSKRFDSSLSLKLSLGNVLDDDYEFTQADLVQRRYRLGRSVGVSFGYSFF